MSLLCFYDTPCRTCRSGHGCMERLRCPDDLACASLATTATAICATAYGPNGMSGTTSGLEGSRRRGSAGHSVERLGRSDDLACASPATAPLRSVRPRMIRWRVRRQHLCRDDNWTPGKLEVHLAMMIVVDEDHVRLPASNVIGAEPLAHHRVDAKWERHTFLDADVEQAHALLPDEYAVVLIEPDNEVCFQRRDDRQLVWT
jgi:hypothetical protein